MEQPAKVNEGSKSMNENQPSESLKQKAIKEKEEMMKKQKLIEEKEKSILEDKSIKKQKEKETE